MPKAGYVKVYMTSCERTAAVRFLHRYEPPVPTLIESESYVDECRERAARLICNLSKPSRGAAGPRPGRQLLREDARWLGGQLDVAVVWARLGIVISLCWSPELIGAMQACSTAVINKPVGRPRRQDTDPDAASDKFAKSERSYQNLVKRWARYRHLLGQWSRDLDARGESLITSTELPPEPPPTPPSRL